MNNKKSIVAIMGGLLVLIGTLGYTNREAVAVLFRQIVYPTTSGRVTDNFGNPITSNNATSSPATLRYVDNGATTTTGVIAVKDMDSMSFAIKARASTSPATVKITYQYGIDVPVSSTTPMNAADSRTFTTEWFEIAVPVTSPLAIDTGSTSRAIDSVYLSSSSPAVLRTLGVATSSDIIKVPTYNADYIRINATILGSAGVFWISPILRNNQ